MTLAWPFACTDHGVHGTVPHSLWFSFMTSTPSLGAWEDRGATCWDLPRGTDYYHNGVVFLPNPSSVVRTFSSSIQRATGGRSLIMAGAGSDGEGRAGMTGGRAKRA